MNTHAATDDQSPAPDLTGRALGKFDIREKLGERDGVEIYRARQTNIGRLATLHVLSQAHSADPERSAAFVEEAKAMARLSHNRVQSIHEASEAEGRRYFSCDFLGDCSLETLLSRGEKISPSKALEILCLATDIFDYCEKRQIALRPLTAEAVLLPQNALPRLTNLATAGPGESPSSQKKALGGLILGALEASPDSEAARGIAARLIEADSHSVAWEEIEASATAAITQSHPLEFHAPDPAPSPSLDTASAPKKGKRVWLGATASLAIVAAVGLMVFLLPARPEIEVKDLGTLVEIPGGDFDFQGKTTNLPTFYISKYEVTIAEYQRFLEDLEKHPEKAAAIAHPDQPPGKSHVPKGWADRTEIQPPTPGYHKRAVSEGQYLGAPLTPDSPVFGVDWFDASAYAKWAGRRLPTEREWEKAARGPASTRHPWGEDDSSQNANLGFDFTPSPDAKAGGDKDGFKRWSRVDLPATDRSGYGVHGMAGNVSEWTANRVTGENGTKNPVLRGANWMTGAGNSGSTATALRRDTDWKPLQSCETIGFRTASDNPE